MDYDDANPPTPVPGDPAVVKIAVTSLRALEPTGLQGMSRVETRPVGSVLFGLPSGTGRPAPGDTGLYQNAVGARRDIEALPRALGGSSVGALLARAWGFAVCRYAGACSVPAAGPSRDFGFRSNVAVPANTAKQRLAMGGRPKGKRPPKKPKPSPCEKLRAAVTAARDEADARARAYADKTLRNPDNVDQYEKDVSTAVDQMLKKGNTESGSKYGGSGPSVDDQIAGTGQDCQTHITDQGSYDGLPPPVKDGTDKHEATHRNQCTGDHTTYRGGGKYPSYRGDLEADAYRAEVAFYNQWLADHPCPGN